MGSRLKLIMLLSRAYCCESLFGLVNCSEISRENVHLTIWKYLQCSGGSFLRRTGLTDRILSAYLIYNFGIICNSHVRMIILSFVLCSSHDLFGLFKALTGISKSCTRSLVFVFVST